MDDVGKGQRLVRATFSGKSVPRQPRSAEVATNRLAGNPLPRQELELRGYRLGHYDRFTKDARRPAHLAWIPAGLERRKGSVVTAEKAIRRCAPARTGQMRTRTRRCERAQNGSMAIAADGGWNGGDRWHDRLRVGR